MSNTHLSPDGVAPPFGSYSHAVQVEPGRRWLHVSGQVGVAPDDFMREIEFNSGMTLDDIVKVNVFLTRPEDVTPYRVARDEALQGRKPASTLLVVQALASPDWLVEIELIAARAT